MARVFTITEGLENLGALRVGGQGSVYKGRRADGTITAIKLLPTPIHTESAEDKHYMDFKNEVEKLKKVNEHPNPYVVKILSYGITETGSLPFIEMEFIEGPDLEELLKPPHSKLFSINEAIKVAQQLSNALAHCHAADVKHGDIKTNNVKLNNRTHNYMLLDFGLAIMSDEQRRTSLRHAGAIEFMAPEQNEGKMFFETDVYSFGIILYELLAGRVPFPLNDKGETARNKVMVAHMEAPVPDLLSLRENHLPPSWDEEQQSAEMQVPDWLIDTLHRCLEKKPGRRFQNGIELHEHILKYSNEVPVAAVVTKDEPLPVSADEKLILKDEDEKLTPVLEEPIANEEPLISASHRIYVEPPRPHKEKIVIDKAPGERRGLSRSALVALIILGCVIAAAAGYLLMNKKNSPGTGPDNSTTTTVATPRQNSDSSNQSSAPASSSSSLVTEEKRKQDSIKLRESMTDEEKRTFDEAAAAKAAAANGTAATQPPATKKDQQAKDSAAGKPSAPEKDNSDDDRNLGARYKVSGIAHFYNDADESTKRDAFINHWNNAILKPLDEKNGFIYVIYTNEEGQTSRGWIKKSDLIKVRD